MSAEIVRDRYVALKLHFTSDSYDFFKYNGKVKPGKVNSRDRWRLERIGRKYQGDELVDFIVANLCEGKAWVGDYTDRSYMDWRKRVESLQYHLREQLDAISDSCNGDAEGMWRRSGALYPATLNMFLGKRLSPETMAATEMVLKYTKLWSEEYSTDFVVKDQIRLIRKYVPFVARRIEKTTVARLLRDAFIDSVRRTDDVVQRREGSHCLEPA